MTHKAECLHSAMENALWAKELMDSVIMYAAENNRWMVYRMMHYYTRAIDNRNWWLKRAFMDK